MCLFTNICFVRSNNQYNEQDCTFVTNLLPSSLPKYSELIKIINKQYPKCNCWFEKEAYNIYGRIVPELISFHMSPKIGFAFLDIFNLIEETYDTQPIFVLRPEPFWAWQKRLRLSNLVQSCN